MSKERRRSVCHHILYLIKKQHVTYVSTATWSLVVGCFYSSSSSTRAVIVSVPAVLHRFARTEGVGNIERVGHHVNEGTLFVE